MRSIFTFIVLAFVTGGVLACSDHPVTPPELNYDIQETFLLLGELSVQPEIQCDASTDFSWRKAPKNRMNIIELHTQGIPLDIYNDRPIDTEEIDNHDREHMVSRQEGLDSGLCYESRKVHLNFFNDMDNVILATGADNSEKGQHDLTGWLPPENRCWFIAQTIFIRHKWNMSIDQEEYNVAKDELTECNLGNIMSTNAGN